MAKIYRHVPARPDDYIGRIDTDTGRVYAERTGPDQYVGRVDYATGKVYGRKPGPDTYMGHVELANGRVMAARVGPDAYVARVEADGRVFRQVSLGKDTYLGQVRDMHHPVEGAAAYLFFLHLDAADDKPAPAAGAASTPRRSWRGD